MWFCFFFFFKQKTAYEMRISDWSSDVCSSDLAADGLGRLKHGLCVQQRAAAPDHRAQRQHRLLDVAGDGQLALQFLPRRAHLLDLQQLLDRKSTRLNSSH